MTKTPYKGNYKLSPEIHKSIMKMYQTANYTTEYIAKIYNTTPRNVQRICKKNGIIRTQPEANKLMAKHKHYHSVPIELRVKRKQITNKRRLVIILAHPYCTICGMRPDDGVRLEVDHIDENPQNNDDSNLQVLCSKCNTGKSHLSRYPVT